MANSDPIQLLDSIQGSTFLAIQSARDVFQRRHFDFERSMFQVVRRVNSVVVILDEQDAQGNYRERFAVDVDSKTELSAQELRTLVSNLGQHQLLDHVHGSNLLAIQAAMQVFQKYQPDLAKYKIEVIRDGDDLAVLFADKDRPPGTRGSVGQPGFEVELNARDRRVIRSSFVR